MWLAFFVKLNFKSAHDSCKVFFIFRAMYSNIIVLLNNIGTFLIIFAELSTKLLLCCQYRYHKIGYQLPFENFSNSFQRFKKIGKKAYIMFTLDENVNKFSLTIDIRIVILLKHFVQMFRITKQAMTK